MRQWMGTRMDGLRLRLSRPDALLQLAVLALLSGLLAGGVVVLFRVVVEGFQAGILPQSIAENYEQLEGWKRFVAPVIGSVLIALLFEFHAKGLFALGVPRVIERLAYFQGYLTVRGFILQFVGAALAIISGHSVGREGPHIFLGAAAASLMGQGLALPNNSIRTLVGCGTAAGIAASFNTPLAGVVFALEVVMLEYTLTSFIPVILAAVSATAVSNLLLGTSPAFLVPSLHLGSFLEVPVVLLLGLAIGMISALFNQLLESLASRTQTFRFWQRMLLAGVAVGVLGLLHPEVLGIGYDTVDRVLRGEYAGNLLLILVVGKLLASVASVGLGVPGGMIGPVLFIGACLGGLSAVFGNQLFPAAGLDPALYALLGMGAMMGASLQAPLAALTAMMELTHSPQLIMPGMLTIVVACLTASEIFHKESLFVAMLKAHGMDYNTHPVMQVLRRTGVAGVMDTNFRRCPRWLTRKQAEKLLAESPAWLLIDQEDQPTWGLPAVDLARQITDGVDLEEIDLLSIPAQRFELFPIHLQATLHEALERLDEKGVDFLFVERMTAPGIRRVYGVLSREQVESAYRL